jgi:phosphopantetheine--protein transferase-like protein
MDPDDARDPELLAEYERRCLAPEESAAIRDHARPMTESARTQVIHSKAFMRCVLARYFDPAVHPANLKFEHGEHGKPALVAVAAADRPDHPDAPARPAESNPDAPAASRSTPASLPPLRFSLSHCSRLVALAVTTAPSEAADAPAPRGLPRPYAATHEVGVDCEDEQRRTSSAADKLAKRWLSASEAAALADIADGEERAAAFMRLWTLKEAYVKALGTGIAAHPLSGFDVETREDPSVGAGEIVLTERTPGANDLEGEGWMSSAGGWRFMLVRAREGDGLIAAVCVWAGGDDDDVEEGEEGEGAERGPTVSVRWTVPLRGDFEPGEKPPPVILAASAN